MLDVSKDMEPDKIHSKIFFKNLWYNESYISTIRKLFKKCIEYEMIPYIWKTVIVVPQHKNLRNEMDERTLTNKK